MLEFPLCVLALWRTDTILWLLENSIWCQILVNKLSPLSKGFEINKPLEGLIEDLRYPRDKKNIPDEYTDTADIFQVKFGRCLTADIMKNG